MSIIILLVLALLGLMLLPLLLQMALEVIPLAIGLLVCWWLFQQLGCL